MDCYLRTSKKDDAAAAVEQVPEDPADKDPEMLRKLQESQKTGQEKMKKVGRATIAGNVCWIVPIFPGH